MVDVSAFAGRLAKNFKHYSKWARRNGLDAWRVYDRDVPQFPLIIDLYGERIHLQEYDTGWQIEDADYQAWMAAVQPAMPAPRTSTSQEIIRTPIPETASPRIAPSPPRRSRVQAIPAAGPPWRGFRKMRRGPMAYPVLL